MTDEQILGPEFTAQQETNIVRQYLAILRAIRNGEFKPMRQATQRLEAIETMLQAGPDDPITELKLLQEQSDIKAYLAAFEVERAFVVAAKSYSERNGITYNTWRSIGVEASVLAEAGIGSKGTQLALPSAEPKPRASRGRKHVAVWSVDTVWPIFETRLQRGPIVRDDGPILEQLTALFGGDEAMNPKNVMNYVKRFDDLGKIAVVRGFGTNARNQAMPNLILSISLPLEQPAPEPAPAPRTKRPGRTHAA